jgi:hypothetical protein
MQVYGARIFGHHVAGVNYLPPEFLIVAGHTMSEQWQRMPTSCAFLPDLPGFSELHIPQFRRNIAPHAPHSHSIVAGGLPEMS